MRTVNEIRQMLFAAAPEEMKYEWDNVGLLCGKASAQVTRVLVALDCTDAVVEEAIAQSCELIVTHHPLIFSPIKCLTDETPLGKRLMKLVEQGIAVVSMHTNLDCAPDGVNDILASRLGLRETVVLEPRGTDGQGRSWGLLRAGTVPTAQLSEFVKFVKEALSCSGLRYVDGGKSVQQVAVGGGACADEMQTVRNAGCDTLVTADAKYHQFQQARELGLNLIDAGHFETEDPVCGFLQALLRGKFPELTVLPSKSHKDIIEFL